MEQHIETFVCVVDAATSFSQKIRTQKDAQTVERIQVSSPNIDGSTFNSGVSTLKSAKGNAYFQGIANSLIYAYPYQKAEERGLSLEFTNVEALGNEMTLEGTIAESTGELYITVFYA